MRLRVVVLLLCLAAPSAAEPLFRLDAGLHELGSGIAVVFSPDLTVPGTCAVYEALGFECFAEADWAEVIDGIARLNAAYPKRAIRTLVLETHGTNGHGLKLQRSKNPKAARSYISVGGLRARLEPLGVGSVVLGACNSGRLLRPAIHRELNPRPGDKLFLPPTLGIYGAGPEYDPETNSVQILTPGMSQVEMTIVASVRELTPRTREAIDWAAGARGGELRFVVSDLLMKMLTGDRSLRLERGQPIDAASGRRSTPAESERLFARLILALDAAAARKPAIRLAQHLSH